MVRVAGCLGGRAYRRSLRNHVDKGLRAAERIRRGEMVPQVAKSTVAMARRVGER